MTNSSLLEVPCPRCRKKIIYSSENKWRPFCSERCQMIDLGQWADEKFRVPLDHQDSEWTGKLDVPDDSDESE